VDEKTAKPPWARFFILIMSVVLFSLLATSLWQGKQEKQGHAVPLVFRDGMTIAEFTGENGLSDEVVKRAFSLQGRADGQKPLESLNLSRDELVQKVDKARALAVEYESKNWAKIPLKFGLWILFLVTVFVMMRRRKITPGLRPGLYLAAVAVFGVILGSDPGPMGTVKDAIVLFGAKRVVFPPRMVALTLFLLMVLLANKFICAWGCQAGTLQDLIFRLNRNRRDTKGILRQYRPPFLWTHSVRIAFFLIFTAAAFLWTTDLVDPVDPFKIYNPATITVGGGLFLGLILLSSLFVYRPWCQFFCPFGLVGWIVEKVSLFKITVDHQTCIGCRSCERACPSTVMGAILKRDRVIPDCFACGTCIEVCPTGSIRLSAGRRVRPPEGRSL